MGKNDYDIRIQTPKNKVEDQDSSIVHFKIIFLHQKKNIANGAYFFLLLVISCKIVYSRYLEKFIVHNDFLSSSLISTLPLSLGYPQLFPSSYPPAMHVNFSAWLPVKSTILGPIFW